MLQEELLAWDLSRHRRQVSGSGYSRGNTSKCQQTVPGKQGGEEKYHSFPLNQGFGAQGKRTRPHGTLSTPYVSDLFPTALQLTQLARGRLQSQHEAGGLSVLSVHKKCSLQTCGLNRLGRQEERNKRVYLECVTKIRISSSR